MLNREQVYIIYENNMNDRLNLKVVNTNYKDITVDDIRLKENEQFGDIFNLDVIINKVVETGISFQVEVINDDLYHIHININPKLQKQGLGYKIYRRFINEFGIIYSTRKRRLNHEHIPKIYNKLMADGDVIKIDCNLEEGSELYILDSNPNKEYYIKKYSKN